MLMLARRLAAGVARHPVARRSAAQKSGSSRPLSGGSEPLPGMDPRYQGPKGAGEKPYEVPRPKQDGPPPGGFPEVKYQRTSTQTPSVPTPVIIGLTGLMMAYGFYGVYTGNLERRALRQEKWFIRTNLVPLLQAEEDAAYLERQKKKLAKEAEIMKDVPGWVVGESVYHSKRWMPMPMQDIWYPGRFGPEE